MKNKSGFTIDFTKFNKGFNRIVKDTIPSEAGKGLYKAGNEFLRDGIKVKPYAPFDKGDLRGSARVDKAEVTNGKISVDAGFNIEYAAKLHELTPAQDSKTSWTLPGSGRKFLESKMAMFKNKYMEIVAKHNRGSAK